jgi:2-dehydro-3-deoxygluconokinase
MLNFIEDAKYDIVSLGEVMLRFDPVETRIKSARQFNVYEGGGEYNVARNFSFVFGKEAAIITAFADNQVGLLIKNLMSASGISTKYVRFVPYDGIGKNVRNGLNFTERGFGIRGAVGVSDRGHTAISKMQYADVDVKKLFAKEGVKILHTGGIYTGLSETAAKTALQIIKYAKSNGTIVSYDLNYRPSLWKDNGGQKKAQEVNKEIAKYVDVMIGNEEDFSAVLNIKEEGQTLENLELDAYKKVILKASREYPNFSVIATTLRQVITTTVNNWGAIAWSRDSGFAQATQRDSLEILDRVGGGDSFASGLLYGLLEYKDLQKAVNFGTAHGALAMTTPGDTSMASLAEVQKLLMGKGARVDR